MVTMLHFTRPQAPGGSEFGNLFEEVIVHVEEKGESRREGVHIEAGLHGRIHIGESVVECKREFLNGCRACLPDVVPADADRMPLGDLSGTVGDCIDDDRDVRFGREEPLLLRDIFFQNIVLNRAAESVERDAAFFCHGQIHGKEYRGRSVDRHRGGDLVERDAVEQPFHVGE